MSNPARERIYSPQFPLIHQSLVAENRLFCHSSILEAQKASLQPSVYFIGHPSLCDGDIVNAFKAWGHDNRTNLILTG